MGGNNMQSRRSFLKLGAGVAAAGALVCRIPS
ncbi:twin-arginine translocation signal domain-containing protein [Shewanella oneidensis MR-1]|nr:twin-arginine translocation signal domain-containing protein [Shewanella oneidensis MR-1]